MWKKIQYRYQNYLQFFRLLQPPQLDGRSQLVCLEQQYRDRLFDIQNQNNDHQDAPNRFELRQLCKALLAFVLIYKLHLNIPLVG